MASGYVQCMNYAEGLHFSTFHYNYWQNLGGETVLGEVELFGEEASPAPPSLDETLIVAIPSMHTSMLLLAKCFGYTKHTLAASSILCYPFLLVYVFITLREAAAWRGSTTQTR